MTRDEMQRLLDRQIQDGATEYEALRYLADIIGLTIKQPKEQDTTKKT